MKNYWVSQLDECECRRFENMTNGLVIAQEIRSQTKNSMTNYEPSNSSGDVQVAPIGGLKKTAQSEQHSPFDTSFAEIWRDAQRRRSTNFASWFAQVLRRFRHTGSTKVSMQEVTNRIVFHCSERPLFEVSTGVAELRTNGEANKTRNKAA